MIYYRSAQKGQYHMAYGVAALQDENGDWTIVDTGIPTMEEYDRYGYTMGNLPEGRFADSVLSLADELGKLAIDPLKVKTVVLTHLHWDHISNVNLFPNAEIYVQKKEIQHAIMPCKHELRTYAWVYRPHCPKWLEVHAQLHPIDGDWEILPGLRVLLLPGHTPGSQAVLIDTADGLYAVPGDNVYNRDQYENNLPPGVMLDFAQWYTSIEKVKSYHPKILPLHSFETFEQMIYG
jgi:glyoxylase-like metal-dependent hydrolase (beta-lactamase superfamily II)